MPALPQLYPYKAGPIEPICMPGEQVGIWVNGAFKFYTVDNFDEGIPYSEPMVFNFGALGAGKSASKADLVLLQSPALQFGQFRAKVLDDATVTLFQGQASQRYALYTVNGALTRFTAKQDPCGHQTEFFVDENTKQDAWMAAINETSYPLSQVRVAFWGFRYVLSTVLPPGFNAFWTTVSNPTTNITSNVPPSPWTRVPASYHP